MNLIDAMESGHPFRRSGWSPVWCTAVAVPDKISLLDDSGDLFGYLELADLVATDYEVREPQVTITRAQFFDAWDLVRADEQQITMTDYVTALARRLGL